MEAFHEFPAGVTPPCAMLLGARTLRTVARMRLCCSSSVVTDAREAILVVVAFPAKRVVVVMLRVEVVDVTSA